MTGARRLLACLITLAAWLALGLLPPAALAASAPRMVSIAREQVYLRTGPGTHHEAQWLLGRGYPLQVIGHRGHWLHVRDFERYEGWVYAPLTGHKPHAMVKVHTANLRSGPSTRHHIVGKAQYGELLRTLGHRGEWMHVHDEDTGRTGWVLRRLVWGW